ncbi:DUF6962 family protein [Legionella impletisoli]|uniref:Uncharacterized protein n=1 Tax=Legionella impletisoli TaxID=343510 RepID=A0A917N8T8_9GAMM|nr:hypothetical protein [Legionella impletisoli]GGI77717.1 hypothetical protein GCM10007966_02960 [Legionella impletisoli]
MNAILTNTITDLLLAICLFYFFVVSLIHRVKGNTKFTRFIVTFFFVTFALSLLSSVAHYLTESASKQSLEQLWLVIAFGIVYLNYCVIYAIKVPDLVRMLVIFISLLLLYLFTIHAEYMYIAISMLFIYILAALYSEKLTKVGFLAVVFSNVIWIVLREGANYELGYTLPPHYRYDNDVYHILLILSMFFIYRSIQQGDWSYP